MQTISQHDFAKVPAPKIQRSSFDRSNGFKTTFDAGTLFPIFYDEALPGDTFKLDATFFARLNTPIVPILDNLHFQTFFFEVPVRQVWDNWQKFNGEQDDPGDSTDYLVPIIDSGPGYTVGSIFDYFGLPINVGFEHSALPLRAYNHIYNTWFKDQNLQDNLPVNRDDGPDSPADYVLKNRGKRHDYFTSSLPWPQKSDDGAVSIPLGTTAPVVSTDSTINAYNASDATIQSIRINDQGAIDVAVNPAATNGMRWGPLTGLETDLTEATAATINQLRQSIAVQRLFEKDARGGTRYIEVIKSHFGVTSPDLRLQRPGYLGGGKTAINISPIAQTQATESGNTPQGNLAAIGTLSARNHGFTKSFTEHTIIIGLACCFADLTYQRGLERSWSRRTRFDFYWPELATIGEQEVLNKEIYCQGTVADDEIFSYQERFAEYRYKPSLITGQFRSNATDSLDVWHLSQDFASLPVLGDAFITENVPVDRVIATPDEPQFKLDAYFNLRCARPIPMYGVPGLTRI